MLSLFGLVMGGAALVRMNREAAMRRASVPVQARVERCNITSRHSGGRNSTEVHELRCAVSYDVGGRTLQREVSAGFPNRREGYDEWVRLHPPGSVIALRRAAGDPADLSGFAELVPSTGTARAAGTSSLLFAGISCVLLAASRGVVTRRRRRAAAGEAA